MKKVIKLSILSALGLALFAGCSSSPLSSPSKSHVLRNASAASHADTHTGTITKGYITQKKLYHSYHPLLQWKLWLI